MSTTIRLYYDDSYCTTFTAAITAVGEIDGKPALQMDRTHFYPTSGGQPHDTGRLALAGAPAPAEGVDVVDVVVQDDAVWHVLGSAAAFAPGQAVTGEIDWVRRYDHMQQHSGQHLLSQVFYRLFGFETVSVHFGPQESTLDLDAPALEADQLAAAEQEAMRLVYAALPITAYAVAQAELASIPLRRPPKVTGTVRIVEIADYDYSACGGTHVRTTAEIAPLKIIRQEKRRGQTRVTFLCGHRAYHDYAAKHRLLVETAGVFSTDLGAVPGLVQRSLDQNRDLQRQVDALTEQLIGYEVAGLLAGAQAVGHVRSVQKVYSDRSVDALKQTAALLRAQPQTLALLATVAGGKLSLVFGRSDDVPLHAGNLLRDTLKAFGGSGGGRPEIAQGGGGNPAQAETILAHAQALATQSLV
jgi:alanyl-tRNA synthetase